MKKISYQLLTVALSIFIGGSNVLLLSEPTGAHDGQPHASVAATTSTNSTAVAGEYSVPCYGDGQSGRRVQAVYAVASDRVDEYEVVKEQIENWAGYMDSVVLQTAQKTGGERHIRWVTDNCELSVVKAVISPTADDSFANTKTALRNLGFDRGDRKYIVWADAVWYCGIGDIFDDDNPDPQLNTHNTTGAAFYGRIDRSCWGRSDSAELHELFHTLGAVQTTAPHGTASHHCSDEYDLMCGADNGQTQLTYPCPWEERNLLDCNNDDYFHTAPAPDSYLATHWNTANSGYLFSRLPTDTQAPSAPTQLTSGSYSLNELPLSWQGSTDNSGLVEYRVYRSGQYLATTYAPSYRDRTAPLGTTQTYMVVAVDDAGNRSGESNAIEVAIPSADTAPPTAPTNVRIDWVTETSVRLSWDPSTDNVAVQRYYICRPGFCGFVSHPGTSFIDPNLQPGTTYSYTIGANDTSYNYGPAAAIQVTTPGTTADTQPPTTPTNIRLLNKTAQRVDIAWNASSDNVGVAGYRVYRNGVQIGTSTSVSFGDTTVVSGAVYSYTVRAYDAAGNLSTSSATLSVSVPDTIPPSQPTNLRTTSSTRNSISLAWNPSTDNVRVDAYTIYRNGVAVGVAHGSTIFTDSGLSRNTSYTYTVAAWDSSGNRSALSVPLTVKTKK